MRIKAFCLFFVLATVMLCVAIPVSANEYENVSMNATLIGHEQAETETITVRFSLNGLQNTRGATSIEAHIGYDETALELISVTANHPEGWDFGRQYAEDWTRQQIDESGNPIPEIYFVVMNLLGEYLVKDDNVLYCDAVFRVLRKEESYSFEVKDGFWATYENVTLVRNDLKPETLLLTLNHDSPVSSEQELSTVSSEEGSKSFGFSDGDVTVIEEKPFRTDKLFKILIGVLAAVAALGAGAIIYHYRKKSN